ncbi:ketoacyl-synt-domain-containing protein [Lojkania enalia]|uniref:Ketoacyl-synt-domain-containing protein n=1 Tax=Lojkania enalia TaxID=147567 RepID=A0A9P4KAW0_9PLEO|nr:ketoacyl-synt-domain-containing protein [Didymosphaeria enalia]
MSTARRHPLTPELWSFLVAGRDARGPVPSSRYNISAYYSPDKKPGSVIAQQGYFLDPTNDQAALDTSFFSMPRSEVETLDPQQRLLFEVAREALDDSGETGWKGSNIGVYVGSYGQDWYDVSVRDTQVHGIYQILGPHDFMASNRLSHELDLHGPSMTVQTACSASIIGVNEACMAIARGDYTSAIVGSSNIIMAPAVTAAESEQGVLSPDGSCNTFSANVTGYARGEGIKFRTSKGLPCTSLNIGAVEGAGYLVDNDELLKKMKGTGWRAVQESELLEVLGTVMRRSPSAPAQEPVKEDDGPKSSLVNPNSTLVGIAPAIPLSSPDSSAKLCKDVRMSVFRNIRSRLKGGASSDSLRQFLNTAKANPETLSTPESVVFLSQEIGKKLPGLVLRPADDETDISLSLAQLGLDSMVAVEMRAWWKQMFGLYISILEMLSMVTLEALGKQAAEGLLALHG